MRINLPLCLLVGLIGAFGNGGRAQAQSTEKTRTRDEGMEQALAADLLAQDPALAAAFHNATALRDQERLAEAEAAFKAIAEKAPAHAPTLWRLSGLARVGGRRADAVALARAALAASPVWQAKSTLVEALLMDGHNHPDDLREVARLVDALRTEHPGVETASDAAFLAMAQNNLPALRQAVADLRRYDPDGVGTDYLTFVLQASEGNLPKADEALSRAVGHGMSAKAADELRQQSGIASRARVWRWAEVGGVLMLCWLGGLLGIFVVGRRMSRATLAAIDRFDGRDRAAFQQTTHRIRAAYGGLIRLAAVYFYVSIPVVIAIVVLVAGGIFYGFMALGRIPIKLVTLVGIGALVSIWSMLRSLFVRRGRDQDPGRPLKEADAPALWALLREVAARVGTRPVDAVYLTLATEVAVTERGSMAARVRDAGTRSLILGIGVLDGLSQQQLRGILAHEYGHFSNRDTAGGGLALAVQAALLGSIIRIAQAGGATFYNPAWHFARGFHALFLRITLGASRLQEILADQFSAAAFGARAFADGLRHVVRRSLEFDRNVNLLANRAQVDASPIASLYAVPEEAATKPELVDEELGKRLADPGSPYDSHPPPGARIAWVMKLDGGNIEAAPGESEPAWALFPDRAGLEKEMTDVVNERLREQGVFAGVPAAP